MYPSTRRVAAAVGALLVAGLAVAAPAWAGSRDPEVDVDAHVSVGLLGDGLCLSLGPLSYFDLVDCRGLVEAEVHAEAELLD